MALDLSEFCFHSISLEQMDRISQNVVYVFILTISRLGFLPVMFCLIYIAHTSKRGGGANRPWVVHHFVHLGQPPDT